MTKGDVDVDDQVVSFKFQTPNKQELLLRRTPMTNA